MTATLLPNAKQQFLDGNGKPLAGGSVYFYIPNTSTLKSTWQDSAQTILNTNPVILDASGEAIIWGSGVYRQVVYDVNGNLIWDQITEDANSGLTGNMTNARWIAGSSYTDPVGTTPGTFVPGTTTTFNLPIGPGSIANISPYFDGVFQQDDQIASLTGTTLVFTSAVPVGVQAVEIKIGSTISIGTPSDGTVTDSSVASNAGIQSTKLSFIQAGNGTVRRTVQDKLRERVSIEDFGAKGDGNTDNTAAFASAAAQIAADAQKTKLFFPAGVYDYTTSPNWGIQFADIEGEGECYLRYSGTGNAVILDAGAAMNAFIYGVKMRGFIVQAPATAGHGFFVRGIPHSYLGDNRVQGCGATSNAFEVQAAVCTDFSNIVVSPNETGSWYLNATPLNGLHLTQRNAGETTSYCYLANCVIEGLVTNGGAGILLEGALGNVFIGGTAEGGYYGILTGTASVQNRFFGIDLEANTQDDIYDQGQGNEFYGVDSTNHVTVSGSALFPKFFGGNYKTILVGASAKYPSFTNVNYNRSAGGAFTNNEPTTILTNCFDIQNQKVGPFTQGGITTPASGSAYTNTTGNKQWVSIVANGATINSVAAIRGGVNNNLSATTTQVPLAPGDGLSLVYSVATPALYFYSE